MDDEGDSISLRYAWGEEDYPAFEEVLALYWHWKQDTGSPTPQSGSIFWGYARFYGVPCLVTLAALSLWSLLTHGSWWPDSSLAWLDELGDSAAVRISSPFPSAVMVAFAVCAGLTALSLLDQWLQPDLPDPRRQNFESYAGIDYEVRLHRQGFDVIGPTMSGTYFWDLPDHAPLPAVLSSDGQHVLVVHPIMMLVIPRRAMSMEPASLLQRIVAFRDSAGTGRTPPATG